MSNKDLLKQAIAEAKTIREAAIANAKEALEETLTPHLKEMLAQKLQEMEDADDMDETTVNQAGFEDYSEDPKKHGNIGDINEEEEEEAPEEEAEESEEEEELEIEDMSVEDLKDLIRDIVAQETGHDEEAEMETGEESQDDMTSMDGDSEEIDINELLAELEGMDEAHSYSLKPGAESGDRKGPNDGYTASSKRTPANSKHGNRYEPGKGAKPGRETFTNEGEEMDESVDIIFELIDMFPFLTNQTAQLLVGAFGAAGLTGIAAITAKIQDMALKGTFGEKGKAIAQNLQKAGGAAAKARNVSEMEGTKEDMEEMNHESEKMNENIDIIYQLIDAFPFLNNQTAQLVVGALGAGGVFGLSAIMAKVHQMAKDGAFGEAGKRIGDKLSTMGNAAASARNVSEESEELNEALKAVKILRNQLQEVNLLNAKLLYVNKVFKSNNLSEGQKVNVIAAFDKAETVKEVKLVFETVSKNVTTKPVAIKEHRSFASKATGNAQTTAPKEILSEVSEQVQRWQKLAGIIKS
jgi:hypothetical protein